MKKRLFSTVICAAMVSTMVMGCSSGSSAPATTTAAATAAPEAEVKDTTAADTEAAKTEGAVDYSDVTVEIVAKGFQHDFWKAVKMDRSRLQRIWGLSPPTLWGRPAKVRWLSRLSS